MRTRSTRARTRNDLRALLVIGVTALVLLTVAAPSATAERPSYSCGPGFDIGQVNFDEYLLLPRTQAAIQAGLVTAEDLLASLAGVDRNGNGAVCVQLNHGGEVSSRPFGEYFYNVVDDQASVPAA